MSYKEETPSHVACEGDMTKQLRSHPMVTHRGLAWYRVSAGFDEHPKVESLSDGAFRSLIRLFGYCARQLTDGIVSQRAFDRLCTKEYQDELRIAEIVDFDGYNYSIHGWLEWQESKTQLDAKRSALRERQNRYRADQNVAPLDTVTALLTPEVTRESQRPKETETDTEISSSSLSELTLKIREEDRRHGPDKYKKTHGAMTDPRVLEVYEFWKFAYAKIVGGGSARLLLTQKRAQKVLSRLKDGYTAEDIKNAIRGQFTSDYHCENGYLDLELTCRDTVHLDRFLQMHDKNVKLMGSEKAEQAQSEDKNRESMVVPGNLLLLPLKGVKQ